MFKSLNSIPNPSLPRKLGAKTWKPAIAKGGIWVPPISLSRCRTSMKIDDQRRFRIRIPQQPALNSSSIESLIVVILNPNVLRNRTRSDEVYDNTVSESLQEWRLEEAVRNPDRTILSHSRE